MKTHSKIALAVALLCACAESFAAGTRFESVRVDLPADTTATAKLHAEILLGELHRNAGVGQGEVRGEKELVIHLRGGKGRDDLNPWLRQKGRAPFTELDPGPEGFEIWQESTNQRHSVFIAAADDRGRLYGIGELLRRLSYFDGAVELPEVLQCRTAPAFEVRGTEVEQGSTITELTGSKRWTEEQWQQAVIGYALAGANTFGIGHTGELSKRRHAFIKSLGLKTLASLSGNGGSGPPEWAATEAIGRGGHLCPSIPAARERILESARARFKDGPVFDYVRIFSGDGGGCECLRCAPYGRVYVEMCAALARIIHEIHPGTEIFITNQKLDNAGDRAIFDYLRTHDNRWLRAVCCGPGSNAMDWMPGRRQDHRMDLFRYPGFGARDRYQREMLNQLPPGNELVFFTDVTHWVYSQNGLMDHELIPDRNGDMPPLSGLEIYQRKPAKEFVAVYDRRTFNARPRAYYEAFQETMRYGIGDCTYSEGHHDQFNQWLWQRLLWQPKQPLATVVDEYCRTFFGEGAAPLMAQAIYQFEKNLSTPLAQNPGIDQFHQLVEKAGQVMPKWRREKSYLWMQYRQRAALDQYIQLRAQTQHALRAKVEVMAGRASRSGKMDSAIDALLQELNATGDSRQAATFREEARRFGEASAELYGVRSEGYFNLDQDFAGLGWLRRELQQARKADEHNKRDFLRRLADYEDAGPGGFYDDAGSPGRSPRLANGWPYGDGNFDPSDRESQRTTAFTTHEQQGVTFEYDGLNPQAAYRVRLALVRPKFLARFGKFQPQTSESIYADGHLLADNLELPEFTSRFFEFDIPREATADGQLRLWFQKAPGIGEGPRPDVTVWRNTGGWGTLVSEVWLMRRDKE